MITSTEIVETLVNAGIREEVILIYDQQFVLPTPEWITNKLGASLDKFFFDTGIKYGENQYECNKYAKTATTIADWCWAKTKTKDVALAFGMFGYLAGIGGHMINIAVHRNESNGLYLAFYEPQPSAPEDKAVFQTVCLTKRTLPQESISSCVSCLFL